MPPDDKPLNNELNNCSKYFNIEISNLKKLKVIVTLGKVAFDNCIKLYKKKYELNKKYNFISYFEKTKQNPYLLFFYKHMKKFAFASQIFFLKSKLNIYQKITKHSKT